MKRLAVSLSVLLLAAVAVLTTRGDDGGEAEARPAIRAEFTRTCMGYDAVKPFPDTERDALLPGGAKIVAFRGSFENAEPGNVYSPRRGLEVLKAPVVFPGRRDVTIAVPRSHRRVLGLDYAPERRGVDTVEEAHSSVRFRACPGSRGATGYPGGLLYTGPWPACVPVDVAVGAAPPQRHLLSLGAGDCVPPE